MGPFPIKVKEAGRYFLLVTCTYLLVLTFFFGLGILLAIIYFVGFRSLSRQQAEAQKLRIEDGRLRFDGGVYSKVSTSIPLDRITDITLAQGPLLGYVGVWAMSVQTGGSSTSEATIVGLENPEDVRTQILKARDEAVRAKTA